MNKKKTPQQPKKGSHQHRFLKLFLNHFYIKMRRKHIALTPYLFSETTSYKKLILAIYIKGMNQVVSNNSC